MKKSDIHYESFRLPPPFRTDTGQDIGGLSSMSGSHPTHLHNTGRDLHNTGRTAPNATLDASRSTRLLRRRRRCHRRRLDHTAAAGLAV